ncbi:protein Sym1p [[Candida] anglica]|uniref:Protein SYM1 n=1 Tax=[Candida] anglica TaxID=148631 RepID=A0ABP0EG45_9ASCO
MVFHAYNNLLKRHPFKTNMMSTGILFGAGDGLAQWMFPHRDHDDHETSFNYQRTARAMIYGSMFFAPLAVMWYGKKLPTLKNPFVSQRVRARMSPFGAEFSDVLFRVGIDQLFVPGLVWIPLYNVVMTTLALHEHPLDLAYEKLSNNWWNVLRASWTVWPIFQLFSFTFIPVHLRIVAANFWSIGWNCFLSFVHNTPGHGKGTGKKLEELVDIEDDAEEQTMVYS